MISTPYAWVAVNVLATLLIGCLCATLSARLAGALTPKLPRSASRRSEQPTATA